MSSLPVTLEGPRESLASRLSTVAAMALVAWIGWHVLRWAVVDATWHAVSADQCSAAGACWAVIRARYRLLLFGLYPPEEQWRAALAGGVAIATLLALCWKRMWRVRVLVGLFLAAPVAFVLLMYGGLPGMPLVPTDRWGGLALTLFLYLIGIVLGMPLGVVLALLRRSHRRPIAAGAAFVVDTVRTLPMVMILFTVGVLAPMAFPDGFAGDKLWRVAIAFAFAFGCYQSEIVRAGLQAVASGQDEAARALALTPYQRMRLVLLPQALTNGLPATVNLLVATFKETSIVAIIGYFDFASSAQAAYGNADWAGAYVEVYLFVAAVYFGFATVIGWLGHRIERRVRIDRS